MAPVHSRPISHRLPHDTSNDGSCRAPRRSTTRGRKLGQISLESISDLPLDEQASVLKHSPKYQQKAATLYRNLRDPNARRLTAQTILKPCSTCASQDWPCVLLIKTPFGIRKQISRCAGCRHTRSTCSLKDTAKAWDETLNCMPWDASVPAPDHAIHRTDSRSAHSTDLPTTDPTLVLSGPVRLVVPPSAAHDFTHFFRSVEDRLHLLPEATKAHIIAMLQSVGGYFVASALYKSSPPPLHPVVANPEPYGTYNPSSPFDRAGTDEPSCATSDCNYYRGTDNNSPRQLATPSLTPIPEDRPNHYTFFTVSPVGDLDESFVNPTPGGARSFSSTTQRALPSSKFLAKRQPVTFQPANIDDAHTLLALGQSARSASMSVVTLSTSTLLPSHAASEGPVQMSSASGIAPRWSTD